MAYEYPKAGPEKAHPGVQKAVEEWRNLPAEKQKEIPLLYWLLGTGTPAYKMSKQDSDYQDEPKGDQKCLNCEFIYHKLANDSYICSQIRGHVEVDGWCRLWVLASRLEKEKK